jgi:hypothetical protein
MPLGIIRLDRNLYWLSNHNIKPLSDEELAVIKAYYARIKEFPIEQERNYWSPEILKGLDERLERITAKYHPELMSILRRIVTEAA